MVQGYSKTNLVLRYLAVTVLLSLLFTLLGILRELQWLQGTMRASRTIHKLLSDSILGATFRCAIDPAAKFLLALTMLSPQMAGRNTHFTNHCKDDQ